METIETIRLPLRTRFSYGVGHVLNDMCASMWFSYLLLYFESVNLFGNTLAGYVLLLGQIADAIATPLIGYESDHQNGCFGYGKRKSWHLVGTVCVMLSFPFIFTQCITCNNSTDWARFIYYAPFVVIFQFGWASTQISHLSLIPELTSNNSSRVELNTIRYAFTVISNITVYGIAWFLLGQGQTSGKICPDDAYKFRNLALVAVAIGSFFSVIFHIGIKEDGTGSSDTQDTRTHELRDASCLKWTDWLKCYQFYLMAMLYMCTRLIVNLSQIYLPMYVMHSILLPKNYVALIPLIVYISGFLVSFLMKPMNVYIGRKGTYLIGLVFVGGACIWMWFIPVGGTYQMIGAAIVLGFGTTTILVTSLSMTAEIIGDNTKSSAFVYGAMSFTDKLSNGVAVMLIQYIHPCRGSLGSCCEACVWFYRHAVVYIPGGIVGVAIVVLLIIMPVKFSDIKRNTDLEVENRDDEDNRIRPLSPQYGSVQENTDTA